MRAQAQGTSSAANRDGFALRGLASARRGDATRAPSRGRASRPRLAALAFSVAALSLGLAASPALATKSPIFDFGAGGSEGGQFSQARGIAINETGNGGVPAHTIYVNEFGNNRISSFDADGNFIRTWGWDVVQEGRAEDTAEDRFEVCTIAADCKAGVSGSGGAGQFGTLAGGIAVNQATGDVYALDRGNNRIQAFEGDGDFLRAWGKDVDSTGGTGAEICTVATNCKRGDTGGGAGEFGFGGTVAIAGLGIDNSGNVYVADAGNARVQKFDASGNFIATGGWDVTVDGSGSDPGSITDYQVCTVPADCQAGVTGEGAGQFGSATLPSFLATHRTGDVYVVGRSDGTIYHLTPALAFDAAFAPAAVPSTGSTRNAVTVNWADGHLFFTQPFATDIFELDPATQLVVDTHPAGGDEWVGLAVNSTTGRMYATRTTSATFVRVLDSSFPIPTTTAPTANTGTRATLAGTVNPNGVPLDDCYFEYGPTTSYGSPRIDCVPDEATIGSGTTPVPVSADIAGLDPNGTQYNFRLVAINANGTSNSLNLSFITPTTVRTTPASIFSITATTAVVRGTVRPDDTLTACAFDYVTQAAFDDTGFTDLSSGGSELCDPPAASIPADLADYEVEADLTGLDPGTHYRFRLRAQFANGGAGTGADEPFLTLGPVIVNSFAQNASDTKATLGAIINPNGQPTTYRFEYGTAGPCSANSCQSIPIPDGSAGSDSTDHRVGELIEGLAPSTAHHFRVLASNSDAAEIAGPDLTFTTQAAPAPQNCDNEAIREAQGTTDLPDCLAYEMVSPPDKNQGGVDQYFWQELITAYSRDGNAAAFCTNSLFGDPPGMAGVFCARQVSRRNPAAGRWDTTSPIPNYCKDDRNGFNTQYIQTVFLNPYFDRAFFEIPESTFCPIPLLDAAAPSQELNLYRQDLTTDPYEFDLVAPVAPESTTSSDILLGATDDYSHIVYLSRTNQTDPPDSPAPGNFLKIYDWEEEGHGSCMQPGGCLNLVSKDTGNVPFTTGSDVAKAGFAQTPVVRSAVSSNGDRIYFQNGSGASEEIYMRESNSTTHHVSASECTVDCGATEADQFTWANPSGDLAIFRSAAKLTDDSASASSKLYRWDRFGTPTRQLVDLTVDSEPGDGVQPGALALIGASTNGDVVYFVASGQLVSGEPTGRVFEPRAGFSGNEKIYRWLWNDGSPTIDYLGPLGSPNFGFGSALGESDRNTTKEELRVTPDGRYLKIATELPFDPAADRDSDNDIYRWDEENGWICISCQLPGATSAGPADSVAVEANANGDLSNLEPRVSMSDDGQRIFFSTQDALVLEDTNGESGCPIVRRTNHSGSVYACQDIYQWHDGTVSLVTSGTGTDPFILMGSTASGDNVFFITRQKLVGWDVDDASDIYVARTDGGFSEPPAQPPGCEGEACRGAGSAPASVPGAGSRELVAPVFRPISNTCGRFSSKAKRKLGAAKKATKRGQASRARALRKQARNLNRRAKRCNRRQAS